MAKQWPWLQARITEMEQKAGGDSGTEPGPQDKGGGGMVQFIVRKQSLCMVEAEKFVLRGAYLELQGTICRAPNF